MKTFNKKICIILLFSITAISLITSCKKSFLDRKPQGEYTTGTYPYPKGSGPFDAELFAGYDLLKNYDASGSGFIAATGIRSDDADKGSTPTDGPTSAEMDNFTIIPSNGLVNDLWKGYYNVINKANIALDKIANDQDPGTPPQAKISAEAEAKFLRGYSYFMLVRLFGRIPLVDKIFADPTAQTNIPQSASAVIYGLIETDLQFAGANLPPNWDPTKFPGRATSGAANGILAKVYLTQQKWAMAMAAANLVIGSNQYDLTTSYTRIFGEDGENSKESVFELQALATLQEKRAYGSQFASIQGVRGTGIWNLGWGFNTPSTLLEAAYEPKDPRKDRTILYSGGTSVYGEAVPLGLPNPRYNQKVHSNPAVRNAILDNFSYWMNIRILRYADVLLMYAEAANEVGGPANTTAALAALNSVRERARRGTLPADNVLPNITTTDQPLLREAIRKERRIELAMEHDRFFDLVRWGIAGQVLQNAGKSFVTGKHELLPIPQAQIDISKGVLTQNFGY
ncbi:MAG: RagB/SusD family nutrient uptake outer membrane protein [Candidatus Pedobacter colombiensis]|uniref:RagB/SusD family nutrient uptake outer membrane protein n=1 Tax=Candidatus Pedobacter colombiensis TaxID=3121371 RepID=A0AAJ5W554_9SPHI|nr:RagB/SusD family nutrient uptake outer membrane protein [Pedobacter sp.]WEK18728.1 MAG: RagB/SusD family nutrient uptake outer membrane protein [Pedobacter sp.]